MELEFSEDQQELRSSVRSFLERECPMTLVRSVVEKGVPADDLWSQMVELGWPALTVAEEHGGLGIAVTDRVQKRAEGRDSTGGAGQSAVERVRGAEQPKAHPCRNEPTLSDQHAHRGGQN